jgi:hypothetical protein
MFGYHKYTEILATKSMPSENTDYILSPDIFDKEGYCIKILQPKKYKDVVYKYNTIQFVEDHENNSCTLRFNYVILINPTEKSFNDNTDFKNYLGIILEDILENNKFETKQHGE